MRRAAIAAAAAIVLAAGGYLAFWPVAVEPVAWVPAADPRFTGAYAGNSALQTAERIFVDSVTGPDALVLDGNRQLVTAAADGRVLRLKPAADRTPGDDKGPIGGEVATVAFVGGRPLGLVVTPGDRYIVAEPLKGLVHGKLQKHRVLSAEASGAPLRYVADVALVGNNDLYFVDASSRYGYGDAWSDFVEHRANGRLLRYDDLTGKSEVVLDALHFPTGIAAGPGDEYLLISETSAYRVLRYWLKGERAGQTETFIDGLPGFPAHISWNGLDRFWLALYSPRIDALDRWADAPALRRMLVRLPLALRPRPERRAIVLGFDADGRLRENLQHAGDDAYAPVTSVRELDGWLYMGSQTQSGIARIRRPPETPATSR